MEHREYEPEPKDISREFLEMHSYGFSIFLRSQIAEPHLSITIDWVDVITARRLKAFFEHPSPGQTRHAAIRATEAQKSLEMNVFASGVDFIKV